MFIKINGLEQWVSVHGQRAGHPVLLAIGGAGLALSRMAAFFAPWERAFTVVHWDQPGAGATHERHPDAGPIGFDRLAADGLAVADFVRADLRVDKIVLLGISGGSIVGLKMAKQRPELFSAYVGTGQIVDGTDVTESAEGLVLTPAEQAALAALPPTADQRAQATTMYRALESEMAAFHARELGLTYELPMIFIQGAEDRYTPTVKVAAFERDLVAPVKTLTVVEGGGHAVVFMRDAFLRALVDQR